MQTDTEQRGQTNTNTEYYREGEKETGKRTRHVRRTVWVQPGYVEHLRRHTHKHQTCCTGLAQQLLDHHHPIPDATLLRYSRSIVIQIIDLAI